MTKMTKMTKVTSKTSLLRKVTSAESDTKILSFFHVRKFLLTVTDSHLAGSPVRPARPPPPCRPVRPRRPRRPARPPPPCRPVRPRRPRRPVRPRRPRRLLTVSKNLRNGSAAPRSPRRPARPTSSAPPPRGPARAHPPRGPVRPRRPRRPARPRRPRRPARPPPPRGQCGNSRFAGQHRLRRLAGSAETAAMPASAETAAMQAMVERARKVLVAMLTGTESNEYSTYTSKPGARFFLRVLSRVGLDLSNFTAASDYKFNKDVWENGVMAQWDYEQMQAKLNGRKEKARTTFGNWTSIIKIQLEREKLPFGQNKRDAFGHMGHVKRKKRAKLSPRVTSTHTDAFSVQGDSAAAADQHEEWGSQNDLLPVEDDWGVAGAGPTEDVLGWDEHAGVSGNTPAFDELGIGAPMLRPTLPSADETQRPATAVESQRPATALGNVSPPNLQLAPQAPTITRPVSGVPFQNDAPHIWKPLPLPSRTQQVPIAVGTPVLTSATLAAPVFTTSGSGTNDSFGTTTSATLGAPVSTTSGSGTNDSLGTTTSATLGAPVSTTSGSGTNDSLGTTTSATLAAPVFTTSGSGTNDILDTTTSATLGAPVSTTSGSGTNDILDTTTSATLGAPVSTTSGSGTNYNPLQKNAALLWHGEEKQDATFVDPTSSLGGRCAFLFILVAALPRLKCNLTVRCPICPAGRRRLLRSRWPMTTTTS